MTTTLQASLSYLIPLILVLTILMLGCRRLNTMVRLYIFQSLGLVLLTLGIGLGNHSAHAYGVAGLTFLGKCVLIPMVLLKVIRKVRMEPEVETYVSLPTSMLLGGGLILLSYALMPGDLFLHLGFMNELLKAGIAVVLCGLFVMITRKKAFTQVMGLYVMDNGIFCLTLATIFEMPTIIEMGVFFELLLGALILGILVYRIKQSFDSVNVANLKNLKG
jgi:hydrogenase-4 membrane subunit HyfE